MEPDKKILPDETLKADEPLNVTPVTPTDPTSDKKPTEPLKDVTPAKEPNTQEQIQKHAELREKAEKEAEAAKKEAEVANTKLADARKRNAELVIKTRIQSSNLPDTLKQRALKDPVKWLLANSEGIPDKPTWDDIDNSINTELDGLVVSYEKDFGAKPSPKTTFVDPDNTSAIVPSKTLTRAELSKMTPYEILKLPRETLDELRKAGSKIDL